MRPRRKMWDKPRAEAIRDQGFDHDGEHVRDHHRLATASTVMNAMPLSPSTTAFAGRIAVGRLNRVSLPRITRGVEHDPACREGAEGQISPPVVEGEAPAGRRKAGALTPTSVEQRIPLRSASVLSQSSFIGVAPYSVMQARTTLSRDTRPVGW